MKQHKLLLIVNPAAGRTKSRAPLFDALSRFSEAGYLLSIHNTVSQGDATRITLEEGPNYDVIVAAGGDGTLNDSKDPVRIMDNVIKICMDESCGMAIQKDYTLWTWGVNENGQLGDGTVKNRLDGIQKLLEGTVL